MFDRIKAKEKSKVLLRARSISDALKLALILIVLSLITAAISAVSSLIPVVGPIIALTSGCFTLLFQAGIIRAAFRMNRGDENVRVSDIIHAGDILGKYIAITLWQMLFMFLWNLPAGILGGIAVAMYIAGGILDDTALVFAVILSVAAVVWSIIITIRKTCQYYFSYWIAEDERDLTSLDCIRRSGTYMAEHKWDLCVTALSFLGWDILSLVPFVCLYVIPYKYLTYTSIYEQLSGSFDEAHRSQMLWMNNGSNQKNQSVEGKVEILTGELAGSNLPVKAGDEISIGRNPNKANLVTPSSNTAISGLHCVIRFDIQNGKYIIVDHSMNGTYVNDIKLEPNKATYVQKNSIVKLADGAMILRLS